MATKSERESQHSTSESQLGSDAPLLASVRRDERLVPNAEGGTHSVCETIQSVQLEKEPVPPHGWPTSPRAVKTSIGTVIWNMLVDIVLLALSLTFLAFVLFVITYDRKPTDSHPTAAERFEQASKWGPTIYPILFASVLGRGTHAILLWRLERGERIGTLDILAGSTSLTSTVISQFHLKMISYVGLSLAAIWMLSPVGGQSSFRQITFGPEDSIINANYSYVTPGPGLWASGLPLNSIYVAALLSRTNQGGSPRDAWGNVKVPRIEHYENQSVPDSEGWYETNDGTRGSYSSFIGIPMGGIDSADYVDYTAKIEQLYFHPTCRIISYTAANDHFNFDQASWLARRNLSWNENTTERAKLPADDLTPFTFVMRVDMDLNLNCTIETTYVEVEVSCHTRNTCAASRIRRSRLGHPPVAYTPLGLPVDDKHTMWERLISPKQDVLAHDYMYNPADPLNVSTSDETTRLTPGPGLSSIRLTHMLNSYWAAMSGKSAVPGAFNANTTRLIEDVKWLYQAEGLDQQALDQMDDGSWEKLAKTWPSTGTKCSNIKIFQAQYGWVIASIISSTVLIAASLIPFYIRTFLSRGPDILMNLSSLAVRDNPYAALPAAGTHLDAAERSRYLKDMRIRFGDVEEDSETGRLAIGRLDGDIAPLKKGRKYV